MKENVVFAEVNKNLPELAGKKGKTLSVLKLAVNSVNFGLWNYLDYFACNLLIARKYIRKKAVYQ